VSSAGTSCYPYHRSANNTKNRLKETLHEI
jgi:hypothetical protein